MDFSQRLLSWYSINSRDLPWRQLNDPYQIWLSEVILQQTRMEQGILYFNRFVRAFPDVFSLAGATEEEVLLLWQGLGYYSRARHLHAAAQHIANERKGVFPQTSREWMQLKGVGPYTAAAIASIVNGEKIPALDGNVYRILSRLFMVDQSIDSPEGKRVIQGIAQELIDRDRPGDFNQAMMDFGSLVCKPVSPACLSCIFSKECLAFNKRKVSRYPVRTRKKRPRPRYFHYFFVYMEKAGEGIRFCVRQRREQDIWKHLYEWPVLETSEKVTVDTSLYREGLLKKVIPGLSNYTVKGCPIHLKHQLTHQTILADVCLVHADPSHERELQERFRLVGPDEFEGLAKPRLIELAYEQVMDSLYGREGP